MSLQHSLLAMFEKVLDNSESFGGSFQSFCMYNSWFYYNSLKLINSFPSRRKFRTKIDPSSSPYLDLLVGVPQGSVLVPLFFYAYMCNVFLCDCESDINYADDTTPYACEPNMDPVLSKLEKDTSTVCTWFQKNYLKPNGKKFLNSIWQCPAY